MSLEKIKKINFFEKLFLRLPIKIRLTIWYSFFIIILFFSIDVFFYLENDKLILKIKDNGIGISKENIEKVWNRFFQVESSRNKDENKGSGLGLSMVKKILELHSTKAEIKSELNKSRIHYNFLVK